MINLKVTKNPVEQQVKMVEAFLNKMAFSASAGSYSILLSGDPGVGKTSALRTIGKLLGMDVLIIEAPGIIQEHISNIPFLVYQPKSDTPHQGVIKEENGQFDLAFSKSYLMQSIKGQHKVSDKEYLEYIYKQNPHIIKLYEALGGTKEEAPEEILDARENYKDILFIDEYFRASSTNVRNSLRALLNRMFGETEVPKTTFIAFASNMNDEGLSEISSHQVYTKIDMNPADKDQWFAWLMDKYIDNDKINLKDEVLQKFYDIMENEHLSHNDLETEIRTSPRRWEQLLLYVNDSIPVKDINDANALLANVKANFTNTDQKFSKLHEGVLMAVKELIKETSNDKISDAEMADLGKVEHDKWSDHLKHQIERNINMGEHRTYVPVVSGSPGIGKNAKIMQVAHELNLGVIMINAMNVDKDDAIGIPVTKKAPKKGESVEIAFHTPKLLHDIEKKAKELDAEMDFKNQKVKYLVYFDELDKVKDIDVFNALRRVVLEKEFANGEKLPEGSVIVAAINPSGTEGTLKFTGHMADVVDVIHAEPNWRDFLRHIADKGLPEKYTKFKSKLVELMEVFGNKFKSEGKGGYWNLEANGVQLYISPRDYTNIFQDSVVAYARVVKKVEKEESEDLKQFNDTIKDAVFEVYSHGLGAMFDKANMNPQDFFDKLKIWFRSPDTDMLLKDVTMRKPASKNEVKKVFEKMISDKKYNPVNGEDAESQAFIAYMDSVDATEFASHLREFVEEYIKDGEKSEHPLHKPKHNYTDDSGNEIPTNERGLLVELKNAFVTSSENNSKKTLEVYLEALMEHKKFKKDFQAFVEKYNEDAEVKIKETDDVSELLKDVYSDANKEQKNPVTTRAREIKKFIETKENDKYVYLEYLVNESDDFVGKPLDKTTTYKNAHKLFHDLESEKPVEDFLKRIEDSIDELDLGGQFKDTVDRELGDELRKLEDEYHLKHIPSWA